MIQLKWPLGILVFLVAATASAQSAGAPASGAPVTGERKGWPSKDRYLFITDCIRTAQPQLTESAARYYCYCMQDQLEQMFPDIDKANALTEADLEMPSIQKAVKDCAPGKWTDEDRQVFIEGCIVPAKEGLSEEKAKIYCECMAYKVEKAFPNPDDAAKLTEEALSTPDWQKVIKACLEF